MPEAPKVILLAEDNEDDVYALRRALAKTGVPHVLALVTNGQQAIDYLAGTGRFADGAAAGPPALLLLDLKMPFRSGFEVLEWIREQPALAALPVIVLTGSDEARDHQRAFQLGACGYLVKPASSADLQRAMSSAGVAQPAPRAVTATAL